MSDEGSGRGKLVMVVCGLVAAAFVVGAVVLQTQNLAALTSGDSVLALVVLAAFAIGFEMFSAPLAPYGYVSLAFFAYFAAVARTVPGVSSLQLAGQAVLVALVALLIRVVMVGGVSGGHRLAYLCMNLVRVGTCSFAYAVTRGGDGFYDMRGILAGVSALVLYVFLDWMVAGALVAGVESESDAETFRTAFSGHWWLGLGFVAAGLLTAGFASAADPVLGGGGGLAFGCVLGALTMVVQRSAMKSAFDEIVVQNQEEIILNWKREQSRADQLLKEKKQLEADLDGRKDENSMVYEMAQKLGATTDLEDTLEVIYTQIKRQGIPFQSCVIFLVRAQGAPLQPAKMETPYKDVLQMSSLLQLEETMIKRAIQQRKPQHEPDLASSSAEQRIFKDERSAIAVPLTVGKETVGVIYVGSLKSGTHTQDHFGKLKMLATYAAPSLKTALLFKEKENEVLNEKGRREAEEAKNRMLSGIQKLSEDLNRQLKLDYAMKVVAEGVQKMIPEAQSVVIFTNGSEDPQQLVAEYAVTPYVEYVKTLPVRKDEGLFQMALQHQSGRPEVVLVPDTQNYGIHNIIAYERSVIVAPLMSEAEVLGCLYVGAKDEQTLTEENKDLIKTVSNQAAMAIKNARQHHQIEMQSLTDGLTGLYTHRYFQTRLQDEIDWSERHNRTMCLVMVDTDHFKTYNDTLGHPAGDALLKEIASLLKEKVRLTDIVCRYGGDEFALILKETTKDDAMRTCERVREAFQLRFSSHKVRITASIGMACFPSDARSKKELSEAADEALYVSKRGGRNRVNASPTLEEREQRAKIVQEPLPRS